MFVGVFGGFLVFIGFIGIGFRAPGLWVFGFIGLLGFMGHEV